MAAFFVPLSKSLEFRFPKLAKEWDYENNPEDVKPSTVRPYSAQKAWWLANHLHNKPYCRPIKNRVVNIPKVERKPSHLSGKWLWGADLEEKLKLSNLALVRPDIAAEWDYEKNFPRKPEEFMDRSGVEVWWKCKLGHSWKARISNRTCKLSGCPHCYALMRKLHFRHPEIARTFCFEMNHGINIMDISCKADIVFWWECPDCGGVYQATAKKRVEGFECPHCKPVKKKVPYEKSLAYLFPDIAAEWHPTLNGDVTPDQIRSKTAKKYWFRCLKHPEHPPWQGYLHNRTSAGRGGCPLCKLETRCMRSDEKKKAKPA